jgi:formiminoglutamate deiminase
VTTDSVSYLAERAWLGPGLGAADDVLISVSGDRITGVEAHSAAPAGAVHLAGITLPGLVNAHSHAFHRALRARSEAGRGDFWSWRSLMYEVAGRIDPDQYLQLATAVYAEMALAGITTVGEFHYLHHDPSGHPYADPNAMGLALIEAAGRAGLRITLLDTCYLQGGLGGEPLEGAQVRFGDGGGEAWTRRVDALPHPQAATARVGVAIHSVRAVPPAALGTVATYAARHELPLHVHLSEQQRENEECLALEGCSPTELLRRAGAITSHTTCVHATHLLPRDITVIGLAGAVVCACPTTERDLADGVGPFSELVEAGAGLCVGTDSHALIDPFEEMRGIEMNERLVRFERGLHSSESLLEAGTAVGAASLGWNALGTLAAGSLADFITLDPDSPRLAGTGTDLAAAIVFAASGADVRHVVVGGQVVVEDGHHLLVEDVDGNLERTISAVLGS